LLRATQWESTAVPELRGHVERLAQHLLVSERVTSWRAEAREA
jgi:uncharacterized NAD(P)/FAD-binding protein YdhS